MRVVWPVPSSPDSPITAGAFSERPSSSPNRLSSLADRRIGGGAAGLELEELVAQHRRQLEVELFGGGLHLLLQHADERLTLGGVGRPADGARPRLPDAGAGDAGPAPNVEHRFDDGPWGDAVRGVVREL